MSKGYTRQIVDNLSARAEAAENRVTYLLEAKRELRESNEILRAERDRLLVQARPMKGIPIIAEITPHPDPVYGHCFRWPAQEVNQFIEMSAADDVI